MEGFDPTEYYRRRERQEREWAQAAARPEVALRHQEMALRYAALAVDPEMLLSRFDR